MSVCLSSWVHSRREKKRVKVNTVNQKALQHGGWVNTVDTHTALHLILSGSDSLSSFLFPSPLHSSLPHRPSLIVSQIWPNKKFKSESLFFSSSPLTCLVVSHWDYSREREKKTNSRQFQTLQTHAAEPTLY